jgi:hypothetical protein
MSMKQARPVLLAVLLGTATVAAASPDKSRQGSDHGKQAEAEDASGARIIIRSDAEKKRRQVENDNSNRQSDADSQRGLERAEERRAEPAETHARAASDTDRGWREYLFGQKQDSGEKTERDWYGYLFGRQEPDKNDEKHENKDGQSRWWWPFDD